MFEAVKQVIILLKRTNKLWLIVILLFLVIIALIVIAAQIAPYPIFIYPII